jgi:hypothetical protein
MAVEVRPPDEPILIFVNPSLLRLRKCKQAQVVADVPEVEAERRSSVVWIQSSLGTLLTGCSPWCSRRRVPLDDPGFTGLDRAAQEHQHSQQPMGDERTKITVELPADLVEECRNAVVYLSGPPDRLTLAGLIADAIREKLDRLRILRNTGEPFPQRDSRLREGRPLR